MASSNSTYSWTASAAPVDVSNIANIGMNYIDKVASDLGESAKFYADQDQREWDRAYKQAAQDEAIREFNLKQQLDKNRFGLDQDRFKLDQDKFTKDSEHWDKDYAETQRHNKASEGNDATRLQIALNNARREQLKFEKENANSDVLRIANNNIVNRVLNSDEANVVDKDGQIVQLKTLDPKERDYYVNNHLVRKMNAAEALRHVSSASSYGDAMAAEVASLIAKNPEKYENVDFTATVKPLMDASAKREQDLIDKRNAAKTKAADDARDWNRKLGESNDKVIDSWGDRHSSVSDSEINDVKEGLAWLRRAGISEKEIKNKYLPQVAPESTLGLVYGMWNNQGKEAAYNMLHAREEELNKKAPDSQEAKDIRALLEEISGKPSTK